MCVCLHTHVVACVSRITDNIVVDFDEVYSRDSKDTVTCGSDPRESGITCTELRNDPDHGVTTCLGIAEPLSEVCDHRSFLLFYPQLE